MKHIVHSSIHPTCGGFKTSKGIKYKIVCIHYLIQYMGQGREKLLHAIVIFGTWIYEILFKNVLYINECYLSKTIPALSKKLVILFFKCVCVGSMFIFTWYVYRLV
jgi:hypothetical protein